MSFLAPLFLLGTLAVGLPLLFHLIRRTTRERTSFSSLMFLQPSPPRLTRRSRLEHLLLLALRCLVLCLLALGFARPLIKKPVRNDPSTAAASRILVLVDASASMRRANLWSDARDKVKTVLQQAMPADQVALYTFDREVTPLMTFDQWNAAPLGERAALACVRLAGIAPGWAATHLGNALISAAETLADTGGKSPAGLRQIILISDLQEGSHLDQLQGYEWPKGVELMVEILKPKHAGNAGLQLATESEDADPKAVASIRVRVSNSSDSKREQFQVGWAQPNGNSFAGKALDVYVPPGQSRIVAVPLPPQDTKNQPALAAGSGSAASERIILQGDEEAFDNTVFVIPPATSRLSVVYLANDSGQDPRQPLYFLERAFQETRRQAVQVLLSPAEKPISEAAVQAAALLIATDSMPEARARALRAQAAAGQTLLFALKNDAAAAASLASLVGVDRLKVQEAQPKNYAMLTDIDFRNPLFAPFADPRFSDFTRIHFWKYRRVDPSAIPNSRVLAKFDGEAPAILEVPIGKGRLIVFTSGWYPEDSQLALSTKFVPLLYALLEDSAPGGSLPVQYAVGDVLPLATFAAGSQSALSIAAPDGSKLILAAGETNFSRTMTPGIYTLDSTSRPVRFAVNLDPAESRTAALPSDELERLGAPMARQTPIVAREADRKALLRNSELENRQKLWRWLIIAAFAVLMIETWLAGKTARGLVNKDPQTA